MSRDPFEDEVMGAVDEIDHAAEIMGSHFDGLAGKNALRQDHEAELARTAPFVRTNPASFVGRAIGNTVSVTTGQKVQVAQWVGDDSEAKPVTITLQAPNYADVSTGGNTLGLRPYAIVQFGSRGLMATIEVDIAQGTQFTVSGSSVTVQVGLDAFGGTVPPTTMNLTGMMACWSVSRPEPAYRTRYIDLGNYGSVSAVGLNIPIPKFSRKVWFMVNDYTTKSRLTFYDAANQARYYVEFAAATNPFLSGAIPVGGDIVNVQLTYPGAVFTPNTNAELIFEVGV